MIENSLAVLKEQPSLVGLAAKPPARVPLKSKSRGRFFGFFTANIRNKNTRRAYYKAACRFSEWCEGRRGDTPSLGEYEKVGI